MLDIVIKLVKIMPKAMSPNLPHNHVVVSNRIYYKQNIMWSNIKHVLV